MSRSTLGAGLTLCALVGCYSFRLAPEDAASVRDAAELELRNFQRADAATLAAAFDRAAYCANESVLDRNDAGEVDSGGAIECHPKPPVRPPPLPATCLQGFVCAGGMCACSWSIDAGR